MPRLTKPRIDELNQVLDDTFFTSAGFEVESFDQADKIILITFKEQRNKFIALNYITKSKGSKVLSMEYETVMEVTMRPGDLIEREAITIGDFENFLALLKDWAERVKSEVLLVNVFQKQFEEFQAQLNEKLNDNLQDPDAHFTPEEREELYERLRKMEERLSEIEAKSTKTERKHKEILGVIKDLAQAAEVMSKRTWYKTAASKFFVLSKKALATKPVQDLLVDVAHKWLLDSPSPKV